MKVLFISPYPTEGPSSRYRLEQYLPYFMEENIEYSLRPFVPEKLFRMLYKRGNIIKKALYFTEASMKRLRDLIDSYRYDLIFVHLEAFPLGPAVFEWLFSRLGKPVIFDFEDAIYLKDFRGKNRIISFLRCPEKFFQILRLSDHVIVCNNYMKDFVGKYNNNITVIPTSVDTGKFKPVDHKPENKKLVIGWIGSHSTLYCLNCLKNVFGTLAKKYDFLLKIIGGGDFKLPGVEVVVEKWSLQNDIKNFQNLDIGVYPLPDYERALAKTPFKTLQYMSVGVPAVVSRIGGNIDIIQDGENGFLAGSEEEWIDKLSRLIESPELRRSMGIKGRDTVEAKYSLRVNAPKMIQVIKEVYSRNRK